jgi:hypothetical protein
MSGLCIGLIESLLFVIMRAYSTLHLSIVNNAQGLIHAPLESQVCGLTSRDTYEYYSLAKHVRYTIVLLTYAAVTMQEPRMQGCTSSKFLSNYAP